MKYETREAILDYLWMLAVALGTVLFILLLIIGMLFDFLIIRPAKYLLELAGKLYDKHSSAP